MIIIVMGLPGSGKSYFASRLAKLLRADYINSDRVRKKMIAARTYSANEKLLVYNEMLAQMKQDIQQHKNGVLDATFYKNDIREKFVQEAKKAGGIVFIEVKAEENLIEKRLQQKREDSEADVAVYKIIKEQWEPLQQQHLVMYSTDDNIHDLLRITMDYLRVNNDKRTDQ